MKKYQEILFVFILGANIFAAIINVGHRYMGNLIGSFNIAVSIWSIIVLYEEIKHSN